MVKNPNLTRFSLVQCGQVSVIVIAMNNSTTTHYRIFEVSPAFGKEKVMLQSLDGEWLTMNIRKAAEKIISGESPNGVF